MAKLTDEEAKPSPQYADNLACECPCNHAAPIQIRVGYIICTVGKEKLCEECIMLNVTSVISCHHGHE